MPKDKISMRQMLTLLFAALLSPAVRVLPVRAAEMAGRGGWFSALAALPVLLALCGALFSLFRNAEEGDGLTQIFEKTLGRWLGRLVTLLYLLWGLGLLCANARLFGLRFLSTSYRNAPLPLFIFVLLALALWLAGKKLPVLARAGQIFYLALAVSFGFVLILGAFRVEPKNVLPVWGEDIPGILQSALPALAVLGYVIYGGFLGGSVARGEKNCRKTLKWAAVFCLVLTAMQWVCLGSFGPGLTVRMDSPFFMMVKGVGVEGAFERVESVLIALWVLSDLALLALLLLSCSTMARDIFPIKEPRSAALPLAALALIGALFLFPDAFALYDWMDKVVLPGNLIFGFAVPAIVFVVSKLRKEK